MGWALQLFASLDRCDESKLHRDVWLAVGVFGVLCAVNLACKMDAGVYYWYRWPIAISLLLLLLCESGVQNGRWSLLLVPLAYRY